jgi:hypothetical protein
VPVCTCNVRSLSSLSQLPAGDPRPLHGPNLFPTEEHAPGLRTAVLEYMREASRVSALLLCASLPTILPPISKTPRRYSASSTIRRMMQGGDQRQWQWANTATTATSLSSGRMRAAACKQRPTPGTQWWLAHRGKSGLGEDRPFAWPIHGFHSLHISTHKSPLVRQHGRMSRTTCVCTLCGSTWVDVPPVADALVVNLGDALEHISGGLLRATPHRVLQRRGAAKGRLSFPFFFDPSFVSGAEA